VIEPWRFLLNLLRFGSAAAATKGRYAAVPYNKAATQPLLINCNHGTTVAVTP
jgi:hypothetical protein